MLWPLLKKMDFTTIGCMHRIISQIFEGTQSKHNYVCKVMGFEMVNAFVLHVGLRLSK